MSLQEARALPTETSLQPRTCVLYGCIEPHSVYDIKVEATLSRQPKEITKGRREKMGILEKNVVRTHCISMWECL